MKERVSLGHLLFPALTAAVLVALILGTAMSLLLSSKFGEAFPELRFSSLLLYALGLTGRPLILAAGALALALFLLLLPFDARRWRTCRGVLDRPLALFTGILAAGALIPWALFYVNSNWLRFSREPRAYAVDALVVLAGLLVGAAIVRWWPDRVARVPGKVKRVAVLIVMHGLLALSLVPNPFALVRHLPSPPDPLPATYDSEGGYLGSETVARPPWNVLLLSIDTLRADGLSCYGNPRPTSPHIDRLATEGIRFAHVLAQSSWTLPSHMTMLTGLYPSVHGCITSPGWSRKLDRLDEAWVTLPEVLRGWGYATAAYTDGKLLGPAFGFDQGFDVCDDSGGGIRRVTEKGRAWLERHMAAATEQPFFLFLHCYDVHHYRPPEEFERRFVRPYEGPLLKLRRQGSELETRVTSDGFYKLGSDDLRYLRDLYDAEIAKTDAVFGGFLEYLSERGLDRSTIVIVTSDHGEEFWEHGGTGHGWTLHQHQLRVPLIIRAPGLIAAGSESGERAGLIDIVPTVLDLLDLPIPAEVQGISLLGYLEGQPAGAERVFVAEASHLGQQKALLTARYSFLFHRWPPIGEKLDDRARFPYVWRNILRARGSELYDLSVDPDERHSVLREQAELGSRLQADLLSRVRENLGRQVSRSAAGRVDLDERTREHLRSLGYIR